MELKQKHFLIRVLILCICSSIVCWKCFEIIQKFLGEPQGTKLENVKVTKYDNLFPAITICKKIGEEFNDTVLESCDIEPKFHRLRGVYSSNVSALCRNPELLYETIVSKFESFISGMQIRTFDTLLRYKAEDLRKHWKITDLSTFGRCFTYIPDNNLVARGISFYQIKLLTGCKLYIHDKHIFSSIHNLKNLYKEISLGKREKVMVSHQIFESLSSEERPCDDSDNYNFDKCNDEYLYNELIDTFGCTTPYAVEKHNICTFRDPSFDAFNHTEEYIKKGYFKNNNCIEPCKYIEANFQSGNPHDRESDKNHTFLKIYFKQTVQKIHSYYIYDGLSFIAEMGGYIGLFTGFSFYNFADIFTLFLKKV